MGFETKFTIYELRNIFFVGANECIINICGFINQLNKQQEVYKVGDEFKFENKSGIYFKFYTEGIFGINFAGFHEDKLIDFWEIFLDMYSKEIIELFIEIVETFDLDWEKDKDKYTWFETNPKLEATSWLEVAKDFINKG